MFEHSHEIQSLGAQGMLNMIPTARLLFAAALNWNKNLIHITDKAYLNLCAMMPTNHNLKRGKKL